MPAGDPRGPAPDAGLFAPLRACWVCGGTQLARFHELSFDFGAYREQDPELFGYTGRTAWLVRCAACGFAQPDVLPTLPNYFDRMYDQQWSAEWIEHEFHAAYKDFIFGRILAALAHRRDGRTGRLLDIGAHAGRFMHLAQHAGWDVEGIELNPRTAECAARRTGAPVHRVNAQTLGSRGHRYAAVTLTDVLEHIPHPVSLLTAAAGVLEPGGWIAVKVPCGTSQWWKEQTLAALVRGRRVSLADNLVHVNHFSPRALGRALAAAGFTRVAVQTAPPELPPLEPHPLRAAAACAVRLGIYAAGRLPGAVYTPLALHLQAYAQKPAAADAAAAGPRAHSESGRGAAA
ncbi:MAG: class I SAM-dependent methyltransferase [Vicinamibacterales bacterium]